MDIPATIELQVGEVYTLRLSSLGTAGYVWSCAIEGNANLVEVTAERALPQSTGEQVIGTSADEIFTISARQPGQVKLYLTQQRPWEIDRPPHQQYTVEVTIQPQGS